MESTDSVFLSDLKSKYYLKESIRGIVQKLMKKFVKKSKDFPGKIIHI